MTAWRPNPKGQAAVFLGADLGVLQGAEMGQGT